ncbi:MAG: hypothetical protein OC190_00075 [Novosphingobium aromaticivorans]|nr:hypothetical protein [Novosphingobium aromaticivorans]
MIHVTTYAIQRYQDQVRNLPDRDVLAPLSGPVIELAADFGAPCVRLPTGHRVMLKGHRVITVFAAGTGRGAVFGWGAAPSNAEHAEICAPEPAGRENRRKGHQGAKRHRIALHGAVYRNQQPINIRTGIA